MSDTPSVKDLVAGHGNDYLRARAEAAEKLAREAEVELADLKLRAAHLQAQFGETLSMLREARNQLAEVVRERDAYRTQAEARSRVWVVR